MNTNTQITPVDVFPKGTATQFYANVTTFGIYNTTGRIYWQLLDENGQALSDGNIELSAEQVADWDDTMGYIENIVLSELGVTKKAVTLD